MNTYNNLVHKSTKKTQNEVFYSISQTLYDEVKSNCIKNFSFLKNLRYNFKENENCLLKNNILIIK